MPSVWDGACFWPLSHHALLRAFWSAGTRASCEQRSHAHSSCVGRGWMDHAPCLVACGFWQAKVNVELDEHNLPARATRCVCVCVWWGGARSDAWDRGIEHSGSMWHSDSSWLVVVCR